MKEELNPELNPVSQAPAPADYEIPYDLLGKALSVLSGIPAKDIRYKQIVEQENPFMPEIVYCQVWGAGTYDDYQIQQAMKQEMKSGQKLHNQFENSPGYLQ